MIRVGVAVALLALASGCAASVSISWSLARGEAAGAAGELETAAGSDHLDPDAVRAVGEAAGAAAAEAVRRTVQPAP